MPNPYVHFLNQWCLLRRNAETEVNRALEQAARLARYSNRNKHSRYRNELRLSSFNAVYPSMREPEQIASQPDSVQC